MSDRVKPYWQMPPALETAVFAVSERTALAETLFGTENGATWPLGLVVEVKNPGK